MCQDPLVLLRGYPGRGGFILWTFFWAPHPMVYFAVAFLRHGGRGFLGERSLAILARTPGWAFKTGNCNTPAAAGDFWPQKRRPSGPMRKTFCRWALEEAR